jgi:hypothetical protein
MRSSALPCGLPPLKRVANARRQPRAIGSEGIRPYSDASPENRCDDCVSGIAVARDGTVRRIALPDIDGGGACELLVSTRSGGSGSCLCAPAFAVTGTNIGPVAGVDDLDPGQAPTPQAGH